VKVEFQNPLALSRGIQPDQFLLTVKDPKMFVSNETGESIPLENLQLLSNIPRMVPRGVNATAMLEQAEKSIGGSMNSIIALQLVGQKFLKGNMDDFLSLFFAM